MYRDKAGATEGKTSEPGQVGGAGRPAWIRNPTKTLCADAIMRKTGCAVKKVTGEVQKRKCLQEKVGRENTWASSRALQKAREGGGGGGVGGGGGGLHSVSQVKSFLRLLAEEWGFFNERGQKRALPFRKRKKRKIDGSS